MAINPNVSKISCIGNVLHFDFEDISGIEKLQFRLLLNPDGFIPANYRVSAYEVPIEGIQNFSLSLNELVPQFKVSPRNSYTIQCVCYGGGEYRECLYAKGDDLLYSDSDFSVSVNTRAQHNLFLNITIKRLEIQCSGLCIFDDGVILAFPLSAIDTNIVIARRYEITHSASRMLAKFAVKRNGEIEIPFAIFKADALKYTCDFYYERHIKSLGITLLADIAFSGEQSCESGCLKLKFYENISHNLSLYVVANITSKTVMAELNDGKVLFKNANRLMLLDEKGRVCGEYNLEIPLNKTYKLDASYTIYEMAEKSFNKLNVGNPVEYKVLNKGGYFTYLVASNAGISLTTRMSLTPVKIATWASCYIRLAFRNDYNLNWRDYFDIVCHYFQPSVFSLVSKPIQLPKDIFGQLGERETRNLYREFDKTAFDELTGSGAEYLLMDFYADVLGVARRFEDDTYIGNSLSIFSTAQDAERAGFRDKVALKSDAVDVYFEDYIAAWKEKCDELCARIIDAGYGDRVILAKGYFNTLFLDTKQNKINNYNNSNAPAGKISKSYVEGKRILWDQMNDYFVEKLPNTRVIDLTGWHFYADANNALLGPHHFEKNYYRAFFDELIKNIWSDSRRVDQ